MIGRQHPPEVTGFKAQQAFIEALCNKSELAQQFRQDFLVLMVPLVNPDGVDLGHWRHNFGGIDLNRDWQYFNQHETQVVRDFFEKNLSVSGRKLLFEIDFHSTSEDLFYVFPPDKPSNRTGLTHAWLDRIEEKIPDYKANRIPSEGNSPVSTWWFHQTFNAEAVTYEVGDDTPRRKIRQIGGAAAEAMMELLVER